jgi:hypothetical protein
MDESLEELIDALRKNLDEKFHSRELSLARTKLDEMELWLVKAGAVSISRGH